MFNIIINIKTSLIDLFFSAIYRHPNISALLTGILCLFAFSPFDLWPFAFVVPVMFYFIVINGRSSRHAIMLGFLYGVGLYAPGISWFYIAINTFSEMSAISAALLTIFFIGYFSIYSAVLAYITFKFIQKINKRNVHVRYLMFVGLWVAYELFRGWFLTGFTWFTLGYSQTDTVFAGYAPLLGVYGISLFVLLASFLVVLVVTNTNRKYIYLSSLMIIVIVGFASNSVSWTKKIGKPINVAIVQDNLPQEQKWDQANMFERKEHFIKLSGQHWNADLIVWPENSMTQNYTDIKDDYLAYLKTQAIVTNTDIVLGLPVKTKRDKVFYASMMRIGKNDDFYYKRHLVPFGEYTPFENTLKGLNDYFGVKMSNFITGQVDQSPISVAGHKAAISICFEDTFGEEIIDQIPDSNFIINGSNNALYGKSLAQEQHFQISRMRSIETGRDFIRASVNGITATIDHKGKVIDKAPQYVTHVLTSHITPRTGNAPYVVMGNYPVIILSLLLFFMPVIYGYITKVNISKI